MAIAVLATVLLVDDDETTTSTTIDGTLPTTTAPASTTPDGSGGTGGGTTGGGGVPAAALQEVERILGQSAVGRAEIIDVVNGVMTCAIPLDEASARLDAVSSNRQAVLAQVDALGPSGNATLDRAIDLFGQSIVSSLEANAGYLAWFDWLGSTQGAFYSGGCLPSGTAPTNADYDDATAASARATAAKAEFVSLFNPIAQAAGLRTWSDTEI